MPSPLPTRNTGNTRTTRDSTDLWLQAVSNAANARRREGEVAPAVQSLPLLAQAAGDFESLAKEYALLGNPQNAAAAQNALAGALQDEGTRASGDREMALLDQAVQAYQNALEFRTRVADAHARENAETVAAALQRLEPDLREVVELKTFSGLTFQQISQATGLPQGTAATRYRSALAKMRAWFARQPQ